MFRFKLFQNTGSELDLTDYLGGKKLILVFFRGAWCNFCKTQLKEIQDNLARINTLNAKVIALSGDNNFNSSLLKEFLKLDFPVLSDSAFSVINLFDLSTTYKEKTVSKPAVIIFDPNGQELFKHVGLNYDDRLSTEELLTTLKSL
jgi:peroxiredoxin